MKFRPFFFCFISVFLFSCVTINTQLPENATAEEMFFHAQVQQGQIKTKKDNEAVIELFQTVADRFPEYKAIGIECRYEIAYVLYRQKKYRDAEDAFYGILRYYETNDSEVLPDWPKTLSELMIGKIEEKTKPKEKSKPKKGR